MSWNCGKGFLKQQKLTETTHFMKSNDIDYIQANQAGGGTLYQKKNRKEKQTNKKKKKRRQKARAKIF